MSISVFGSVLEMIYMCTVKLSHFCIVLMPSCLWLFSAKNESDTKQCTSAQLIFTIYILRRQRLLFHHFKLSVFKLDRSDCDCFPSVRNCSVFLSFMPFSLHLSRHFNPVFQKCIGLCGSTCDTFHNPF